MYKEQAGERRGHEEHNGQGQARDRGHRGGSEGSPGWFPCEFPFTLRSLPTCGVAVSIRGWKDAVATVQRLCTLTQDIMTMNMPSMASVGSAARSQGLCDYPDRGPPVFSSRPWFLQIGPEALCACVQIPRATCPSSVHLPCLHMPACSTGWIPIGPGKRTLPSLKVGH